MELDISVLQKIHVGKVYLGLRFGLQFMVYDFNS